MQLARGNSWRATAADRGCMQTRRDTIYLSFIRKVCNLSEAFSSSSFHAVLSYSSSLSKNQVSLAAWPSLCWEVPLFLYAFGFLTFGLGD